MRYTIDDTHLPELDEVPVRVVHFYSREWRSWGVFVVNAAGDQIGDAEWGVRADLPRMIASAEARLRPESDHTS